MNDMPGNPYAESHQHRPGVTEDDGQHAIAQATLALAFEQRTANQIAWISLGVNSYASDVDIDDEVRQEIGARLGIEDRLGVEVVPDPEPTNADRIYEKLQDAALDVDQTQLSLPDMADLAEALDRYGVQAPEVTP